MAHEGRKPKITNLGYPIMKIHGVEVEILKADIFKVKVDVVVVESLDKPAIHTREVVELKPAQGKAKYMIYAGFGCRVGSISEKKIRDACANALKLAGSLGVKSIAFTALGCYEGGFPRLASAKIMAQEIFRYIRQDKRALKNIKFVLPTKEDYLFFNEAVSGYLTHIIHKLSEGPFVTVDIIIEIDGGIVLIKRSNPPFGWAIPGGFVDYGESLEEAAAREAKEETSLVVKNLQQMHTYSSPSRDPRFHTISTVFIGQAKGQPQADSDAVQAQVFKLHEWNGLQLAFDHHKVLDDYLRFKKVFRNT